MVSLDLDPGTLPTLDGGVSDQHITIVFIGKGVSDDLFDQVCERAQQVAASMVPPSGTIGGLGQFPPSESSDWLVPVFAIPDVPAAEILRAHFEDFNASEHKDYHPHVTLGYFEDGEQLPDPVPETPVSFSHLSVHRGDDVRRFPFKGASKAVGEKADEDDFDGVVAGGLIVQARDTGRVLMIQRLPDKHDDDAAYARWEWPGGCLDVDDQGVWQGALREWEEETGAALDEDARHVGSFLSEDGNYQAYVIQVPSEDDLDFDIQPEEIADIGWWDPADLTDGRVRDKVSENLEPLQRFLMSPAAKASAASVHRHTDRIVAHYQPLIAQAFEDLFPQNALEQAIGETQTAAPLAGVAKAKGPAVLAATAVGALRSRLSGSLARLRQILQSLYGDAALQATRAASQQLGGVIGGTYRSLMQELPDDYWDRWQPGWGDAASQLADGGMRDLLDRAGIQIKSIVDTRLNDLGDLIAQGVAAGDSIDKVARDAQGLLSDPSRALMIADTEYARGMTAQSLQDYRQAGVEQIQWLAEDDACPDCLENEAASPIPIGDSWPNGDVPVHPMCRCALVALVDTSE